MEKTYVKRRAVFVRDEEDHETNETRIEKESARERERESESVCACVCVREDKSESEHDRAGVCARSKERKCEMKRKVKW